MPNIDDLLNVKYTLQNEILRSWDQLNTAQERHTKLINKLREVRAEIKQLSEPDLYDQLFN